MTKDETLGYECRHVTYCKPPNNDYSAPDLHVVKEIVHTRDGRFIPHMRMWKNFERPFGITKEGARNHTQKKEWEKIENLRLYKTRQCDLVQKAARAIEYRGRVFNLRELCNSPYIYGADIKSTAVLKHDYQAKFPELNTPSISAPYDLETDMVHGTEDPIMAAFAFQSTVYTVIDKAFVSGQANVEARLQTMLMEHLGEIVERRKIKWVIEFVDGPVAILKRTFEHIHKHKPDFLSIWNIIFDIPKTIETLIKYGEDPAQIMSDPAVPEAYRFYNWWEGSKTKLMQNGKQSPLKNHERWHTFTCPASYIAIDAMCVYAQIRNQMQKEQSYSLDSILRKELERGKLKFTGITSVTEGTAEWHTEMQSKFPLEYILYNFFDVVGMQELDDKIQDLSLTVPMFSGCSDYANFNSQPRRMVDDLHYYCLDVKTEEYPNGVMIGTTGKEMIDEFDRMTIDNDGWIITLPAALVHDNGLQIIEHAPWLRTNFRGHTGDLDVSASYPTNEEVANISKETCRRELICIEGITLNEQKMVGINLSSGQTNAAEICMTLFKMPTFETLLDEFKRDQNLTKL